MTAREKECLDYVRKHILQHGFPPSYEEIAAHLKLASKSGIFRLLRSLVRQGLILQDPVVARGITLPVTTLPTVETIVSELERAHGFDDGDGTVIVCTPEELRATLAKALR